MMIMGVLFIVTVMLAASHITCMCGWFDWLLSEQQIEYQKIEASSCQRSKSTISYVQVQAVQVPAVYGGWLW